MQNCVPRVDKDAFDIDHMKVSNIQGPKARLDAVALMQFSFGLDERDQGGNRKSRNPLAVASKSGCRHWMTFSNRVGAASCLPRVISSVCLSSQSQALSSSWSMDHK